MTKSRSGVKLLMKLHEVELDWKRAKIFEKSRRS
jgi:hypothetical protein